MKKFILRHKFWMSIPILFFIGILVSLVIGNFGVSMFMGNLLGLYIIIGVPIKIFKMIRARK